MTFKSVQAVDGGLRYTALDNHKSDVIDAFSTDGLLEGFGLKVLDDDKNFFPPYYAVPIVKEETLKEHPELEKALNALTGKLTDEKMRKLNYKVDSLKESPEKVAKEFLEEEGLVKKLKAGIAGFFQSSMKWMTLSYISSSPIIKSISPCSIKA